MSAFKAGIASDDEGLMVPAPQSAPYDDRVYVSIAEAVRLIGLSRTKIYELIKHGELDTRKVGKRRLVVRASIGVLGSNGR